MLSPRVQGLRPRGEDGCSQQGKMAPGRMQLCPLPRHSTYYTQYVAVNVAVNSKVWENKGSLIKIKFLSSHWNKIKIKFK